MSRPYAEVIGDPIVQSKSPAIHGFWLEKLGIAADYRATHVRAAGLAEFFAERRDDSGWRGCNVTIPHKERVAAFLDRISDRAAKVGAVNTVWRESDGSLAGTNTDVEGVAESISGIDLLGQHVVLIGAGGAARAALAHLEGLGCASLAVLARNPRKAEAVLADFALPARAVQLQPGSKAMRNAALVINATQLGMIGQLPMPSFVLDEMDQTLAGSHAFDMVYAPLETEFLKRAAMLGRTTSGGLVMLVGQARTAFHRFFGAAPPRQFDAELRGRLTS